MIYITNAASCWGCYQGLLPLTPVTAEFVLFSLDATGEVAFC